MKQILVYGDSLSWGLVPQTKDRLDFSQRWTWVFERQLNEIWQPVRVIENCLNGRRTNLDDSEKAGRNGLLGIKQTIEMHLPLELVIVMLGTNDFQDSHDYLAKDSATGLQELIHAIKSTPIEPGYTIPKILIVSPPVVKEPKGLVAQKFLNYPKKDMFNLSKQYLELALLEECYFFDADSIIHVSELDGVHCDASQYQILGESLAQYVSEILTASDQQR